MFEPSIMCVTTRGQSGRSPTRDRRFHQPHHNIPQTRLSGQLVTFYPDTLIFQLASSVDILDLIKLISLNAASVKPVKKERAAPGAGLGVHRWQEIKG